MQPSAVTNDLPGYIFLVYAFVIIVLLSIICNDAISFYAAGIKEHGAIYLLSVIQFYKCQFYIAMKVYLYRKCESQD